MNYIALGAILLYYHVFLNYYHKLFPKKGSIRIRFTFTLVIAGTLYVLLDAQDIRWLRIPVIMSAMIAGLRFSTSMSWLQAIYGGGVSVLSCYCFRGLFCSIGAFVFQGYNLSSDGAYYIVTAAALIFAYLFFRLTQKTVFPDDKLKRFINNSNQLKLVVAYEMMAAVNLTIINIGRDLSPYGIWYTDAHLSPHGIWYLEVAIGSFMLTEGMLVYAVYESIQSTELLEYQWSSKTLEKQLELQVRHYKSYQKYTESFRKFKHDYKFMMISLKALIRDHNNEKAIQLIDTLYEDMQKGTIIHKKYSDHVILDAILQDIADICEEKNIRYSFNVFVPRNTQISMPDAIRIFSNIANNAVEACENVPISERFINIVSRNDIHWVTLEAVNSYDGKMFTEEGEWSTTKSDKEGHGLGINIVNEIVQDLGGFVIHHADTNNKIFSIRIHIPRL